LKSTSAKPESKALDSRPHKTVELGAGSVLFRVKGTYDPVFVSSYLPGMTEEGGAFATATHVGVIGEVEILTGNLPKRYQHLLEQ